MRWFFTICLLENNIIRNRDQLGYADALCIRRVRVGRGFGEVDLMLFLRRGPHRLVLVEAKLGKSPDARAKVIGQLLWYYAGALALGTHGLKLLRQFASSTPLVARSATRKGLKTLTGGISPPDLAWHELKKGRTLKAKQIRLWLAFDCPPSPGLKTALDGLARHHGLQIGIVSVLGRNRLHVYSKVLSSPVIH